MRISSSIDLEKSSKLKEAYEKELNSSNPVKEAEFQYNCSYIRTISKIVSDYLTEKKADRDFYHSQGAFGRMVYNAFYFGRKDSVDNANLTKAKTDVIKALDDLKLSYSGNIDFPALNLSKFFYFNEHYCISTTEMSMVFFFIVDQNIVEDKVDFMNKFLTNIYDGDEEIYNTFIKNPNLRYAELSQIDNTNSFERFILYNYSLVLNKPAPFIKKIHAHDQTQKSDIIGSFVMIYTEMTNEENKYSNDYTTERKKHWIKALLDDLDKVTVYMKLFMVEQILHSLANMIKIPVLDALTHDAINAVSKSVEEVTYQVFDKKPEELIKIDNYLSKVKNADTADVISLDLEYIDSFDNEVQCKECGAFYDEHYLNISGE